MIAIEAGPWSPQNSVPGAPREALMFHGTNYSNWMRHEDWDAGNREAKQAYQ
jgi:hypothetical protein